MLLEVKNIDVDYGGIKALRGVTLSVAEGEIVVVLGANGAGKSTLLNTIVGTTPCRNGSIIFDGRRINGLAIEKIVGLGISLVPERRRLFGRLTVMDNLILGAYLRYGRKGSSEIQKDINRVFEIFPRLKERRKQTSQTLSGGEQQMVTIGRGLMQKPKLLLLDEPSLGLAPLLVKEIFGVIAKLRGSAMAVLLVEQNARMALTVGDRGCLLEHGAIVLEGTSTELAAETQIQKAYLGG